MSKSKEPLAQITEGEPICRTVLRVCLRYAEGIVRNHDTPFVADGIRQIIQEHSALPLYGNGSVCHKLAEMLAGPFMQLHSEGALVLEDCEAALTMDWFSGIAHLHRQAMRRRLARRWPN
jgi:hypothetical protein